MLEWLLELVLEWFIEDKKCRRDWSGYSGLELRLIWIKNIVIIDGIRCQMTSHITCNYVSLICFISNAYNVGVELPTIEFSSSKVSKITSRCHKNHFSMSQQSLWFSCSYQFTFAYPMYLDHWLTGSLIYIRSDRIYIQRNFNCCYRQKQKL